MRHLPPVLVALLFAAQLRAVEPLEFVGTISPGDIFTGQVMDMDKALHL